MHITNNMNYQKNFTANLGVGLNKILEKSENAEDANIQKALNKIKNIYPDKTVDIFYGNDGMTLCLDNKAIKNQPFFLPANKCFFPHIADLLKAESNGDYVCYKGVSSL